MLFTTILSAIQLISDMLLLLDPTSCIWQPIADFFFGIQVTKLSFMVCFVAFVTINRSWKMTILFRVIIFPTFVIIIFYITSRTLLYSSFLCDSFTIMILGSTLLKFRYTIYRFVDHT